MAQHASKRKFLVVGQGSNPSDLRVSEETSAFSAAQAMLQVEKKHCKALGRVKIFWRDLRAEPIGPEPPKAPEPLPLPLRPARRERANQTKVHPQIAHRRRQKSFPLFAGMR